MRACSWFLASLHFNDVDVLRYPTTLRGHRPPGRGLLTADLLHRILGMGCDNTVCHLPSMPPLARPCALDSGTLVTNRLRPNRHHFNLAQLHPQSRPHVPTLVPIPSLRPSYNSCGHRATWFFNVTLPNILSPHLSRIAMFDLANLSQTWGAHCLLLAMFARQKSLPLLRSFAVRCPHDKDQVFSTAYSIEALYAGTPPVPFVGAENSAVSHPNLKEVTLDATFCDWTKYSGRNLTTLNLSMIPTFYRPTIAQLRTILTMSKDTLKVLKIAGALPREQRKENVIIEMGQLESLSLLYTIPYEIAIFTDSIRVPALKNLEIGNLGYLLTPAVPPLIHDRFYAQIAYVFRRILGEFPVENLEEVALLNVEFGSEVLLGLLAHTEPLELLRRLEKGVQKMKVESGDGSFGWVAGAEGLAHALETWKLKVAVGDHVPSRALRRLNYP